MIIIYMRTIINTLGMFACVRERFAYEQGVYKARTKRNVIYKHMMSKGRRV